MPSEVSSHDDAPPLRVTLLGTGTSTGIPVIGCDCRVCTSADPRDDRTRTACLVEAGPLRFVIDTGPDFRRQALREDLHRLDAALFTHHHFDHIVGLDDLRPFFHENDAPMPCFAHPRTVQLFRRKFPHIFGEHRYPGAAHLALREVNGAFEIGSRYEDDCETAAPVRAEPVRLWHGDLPTLGYRIGRFAYLTDTNRIPDESVEQLAGRVDTLVIDALRREAHPTHLCFEEAIEAARRISARTTYFVHMTHSVMHAETEDELPDDVHLGYDGLSFEIGG
ncbi:MAG: MBL fold metallo-hydrolase [Bacteroidetes bacterium QS_8_64_10]|nr:MAG: MBL fold metallo-hydrolase [Bacteroidetes bacterium QS_8_64_10]